METKAVARDMLDDGPLTTEELASVAGVTQRSAQRALADMWSAGHVERTQGVDCYVYHRKADKPDREAISRKMTATQRHVVEALAEGQWSTKRELQELLDCGHSYPHKIVSELIELGAIVEAGKREGGHGRRPTTYEVRGAKV